MSASSGSDRMSNKSKPGGILHPSPIKLVRFADGKVVPMNRKERRQNKLYGNRVAKLTGLS